MSNPEAVVESIVVSSLLLHVILGPTYRYRFIDINRKVRLGPAWIKDLGMSNLVFAIYSAFARDKSPLTDEFTMSVFKKDKYQKVTMANPDPIKSFFDDVFAFIDYLQNNRTRTRAFTTFEKKMTLHQKPGFKRNKIILVRLQGMTRQRSYIPSSSSPSRCPPSNGS